MDELANKRMSRNFIILCFIYAASLLYLLFQGGKVALMLFLIMTVISIYLVLGRWSGISRIKGERRIVHPAYLGDLDAGTTLHVELDAQIPGLWPIPYVIVKERLLRKNGQALLFEMTFVPDWNRRGEMAYTIGPLRRGLYEFAETVCSTEDIFGLFEHRGSMMMKQHFRILPRTVNIVEWQHFNQLLKGAHHHSTAIRAHRETTQIDGVREYVYGDRLSRIHWKNSARTGVLKSKEFEREALPKMMIVLDRHKASYRDEAHFETAVSIAASLIRFAWREQLAFGLMSSGKDTAFFAAKRGAEHHQHILNHLIEVEADGEKQLPQVMANHMADIGRGVLTLLITPHGDAETMLPLMHLLHNSQQIPSLMWVASEHTPQFNKQRSELARILSSHGYYSYGMRTLEQLPIVLGGGQ